MILRIRERSACHPPSDFNSEAKMSAALIPAIVIPAGFTANYLVQRNISARCDYRCENCGESFNLSALAGAIAPHRPVGRKWVRCPRCRSFSWATPEARGGP